MLVIVHVLDEIVVKYLTNFVLGLYRIKEMFANYEYGIRFFGEGIMMFNL